MEPGSNKPRSERNETDESLRFERAKTDRELAQARDVIEESAAEVVDRARHRAEAILRQARERTDREVGAQAVSRAVREGRIRERGEEDKVVAQ